MAKRRSLRHILKQPAYIFEETDEEESEKNDFENELFDEDVSADFEPEVSDHDTESEQEQDSDDEAAEVAAANAATEAARIAFGLQVIEPTFFLGKDQTTKWEKTPPTSFHKKSGLNSFKPGRNKMPNVNSELEVFELFFTETVFAKIVNYTNLFIEFYAPKLPYKQSSVRPTNVLEIRALFGLLFGIGSLKGSRTQVKYLWAPESGFGWDICRSAMSHQRFKFLMRYGFDLS